MTHKHIISTLVLMSFVLPTAAFAETISAKKSDKKDTPKAEVVNISEKEKDKNRKQRISFALKAVDQNILIVEKSIKQATLRLGVVDQNSPKITGIKNDLATADAKLASARKTIADTRTNLENINTANVDQIKDLLAKMESAKTDISEAIKLARKAVKTLKTMRVVKNAGEEVITSPK